MKNMKWWALACLSALALSGCGGTPVSSSESSLSETSQSESSSEEAATWDEATKALLKAYCGEVLPFPSSFIGKELNIKECTSTSGVNFLQIVCNDPSFILEDYHDDLEKVGWGSIKGYEGNAIRSDEYGTKFCELTKISEDKKTGYNVSYFFNVGTIDATGTVSGSYNCIWCYDNATTTLTEDTKWNENDDALLQYVLMSELPFLKMGSDYVTYQRSTDEVIAYDYCAIDCRESAASTLKENGFVLDEEASEEEDAYVLAKTLEDGSIVTAELLYSSGNLFEFTYSPKTKSGRRWPSSLLEPIEEATGVEIPQFESDKYWYYSKRGLTYIYGYTDGDVSTDYKAKLEELGLTTDYLGSYTNWEENLYLYCTSLIDSNYAIVGFEIIVAVVQSDSNFSTDWPSEVIASFCEEENIKVSCPSPEVLPNGGKDIKYSVETDYAYWVAYWYEYLKENADWMGYDPTDTEKLMKVALNTAKEQIGVFMDIYDPDYSFTNAYIKQLFNLGWHKESLGKYYFSEEGFENLLYEDPTGEIAIYIYRTSEKVSRVSVMAGCGKSHTPSFSFKESSITLGLGDSATLDLQVDMLPYDITFTSDDTSGKVHVDENGNVSIDSDAHVGDEVTITATMNVPGEENPRVITCKVIVAERTPYNVDTAYDAAAALFNDYFKYDSKIKRNYYDDAETIGYFEISFGETDSSSVRSTIEKSLVPEAFESDGTWFSSTTIWGASCFARRYKCDGIVIEYQVYTSDGVTVVIFLSYKEGTKVEPSEYM